MIRTINDFNSWVLKLYEMNAIRYGIPVSYGILIPVSDSIAVSYYGIYTSAWSERSISDDTSCSRVNYFEALAISDLHHNYEQ